MSARAASRLATLGFNGMLIAPGRCSASPAPARSSGGYRLYGTGYLKRLNFIRRARTLGFSIGEVRTLLRLADERKRPCAEVRVVRGTP